MTTWRELARVALFGVEVGVWTAKAAVAWFYGCLAVLLMAGVLLAGPTVIITDTGTYVMTVGADGIPVTERADEVLDKRTGAPPVPGPGPTPGPTPQPTDVTTRVKEAAQTTNDPVGSQLLAKLYRECAKLNLPRDRTLGYLKEGTDGTLAITGTANKWVAARAIISKIITEKEAAGNVNWPALLEQIAAGLEQAGGGTAIPPELLIALFNLLLELLRKWLVGV